MENLRKVFNGIEYTEEWKDIIGYEGVYKISSFGRVQSLTRISVDNRMINGILLKLTSDKDGYLKIGLRKNNFQETKRVHRLVAYAYVVNVELLKEVNHKDEIKNNNFYLNLEWMTTRQNTNYSSNKKSTSKYPGVFWSKDHSKWRAVCSVMKKSNHLGLFINEEDAAQSYICFCAINNLK